MDVIVAKLGQRRGRLFGQRAVALDGIDVGSNLREDRGRITRAGTDFEHLLAAAERQRFGHECDDIGLRDRLPLFDRQGRIVIGKFA